MRRFAIGDVHGCMKSLRTLIEEIAPEPDDELIFLGDYVDRGPDSRDVLSQMLDLRERCRLIALRGNHEIMMLGVLAGLDPTHWLASGGLATLSSYGGAIEKIPAEHVDFLRGLLPFHETDQEIFIHACYEANVPIGEQTDEYAYWMHLGPYWPTPHQSGKRVFVGHTPQPSGEILDIGYLVCLDTYCFGRRYLTAMNLDTRELIQVDYFGHLRTGRTEVAKWLTRAWSRVVKAVSAAGGRVREADSVDKQAGIDSTESASLAGAEGSEKDLSQLR